MGMDFFQGEIPFFTGDEAEMPPAPEPEPSAQISITQAAFLWSEAVRLGIDPDFLNRASRTFSSPREFANRLIETAAIFSNFSKWVIPTAEDLKTAIDLPPDKIPFFRDLFVKKRRIVTEWNAISELVNCPCVILSQITEGESALEAKIGTKTALIDLSEPSTVNKFWSENVEAINSISPTVTYEVLGESDTCRRVAQILLGSCNVTINANSVIHVVPATLDPPPGVISNHKMVVAEGLFQTIKEYIAVASAMISGQISTYHDDGDIANSLLVAVKERGLEDRAKEYVDRVTQRAGDVLRQEFQLPVNKRNYSVMPLLFNNEVAKKIKQGQPAINAEALALQVETKMSTYFQHHPAVQQICMDQAIGIGEARFTAGTWDNLGKCYFTFNAMHQTPYPVVYLGGPGSYETAEALTALRLFVKKDDQKISVTFKIFGTIGGSDKVNRASNDEVKNAEGALIVIFDFGTINPIPANGKQPTFGEGFPMAMNTLLKWPCIASGKSSFALHAPLAPPQIYFDIVDRAYESGHIMRLIGHYRADNRDCLYLFHREKAPVGYKEIVINQHVYHGYRVAWNRPTKALLTILGLRQSLLNKEQQKYIAVAATGLLLYKSRMHRTAKKAEKFGFDVSSLKLSEVVDTSAPIDPTTVVGEPDEEDFKYASTWVNLMNTSGKVTSDVFDAATANNNEKAAFREWARRKGLIIETGSDTPAPETMDTGTAPATKAKKKRTKT